MKQILFLGLTLLLTVLQPSLYGKTKLKIVTQLSVNSTNNLEKICWFSAEKGRWPAEGNRVLPWSSSYPIPQKFWQTATNPITKAPEKRGFMVLGALKNGEFALIWTLPEFKEDSARVSWLEADKNGYLNIKSNALGSEGNLPFGRCLYVRGASLSEIFKVAGQKINQLFPLQSRREKELPEPFHYLGWCTWEQFKKNINEKLLVSTAKKLIESPLPIRWMLIDDGFQTQQALQLKSFVPDPHKFSNGWEKLISQRNEKLKWFGLWHCYYGLWKGISTKNDFPDSVNKLLFKHNGRLYPGKDAASTEKFYDKFMGSVSEAGFDFVKIDVQCEYLKNLYKAKNPVQRQYWSSLALNKACRNHKLDLMNCMAMGPATSFLTEQSQTTRCSIDYKHGDLDMARSHLWQSYHNTLWLGQNMYPDHDMFHSSDKICGDIMARSKAVSGGPIYLSDVPEQFKPENIWPLVMKDGKILQPAAPAFPVEASCFVDPLNEKQLYKVVAPLNTKSAVVINYNLFQKKIAISGQVKQKDFLEAMTAIEQKAVAELPLVAYSWNRESGQKLTKDRPMSVNLTGFSDDLVLVTAVEQDWSVVGATDKYLAPLMVKEYKTERSSLRIELHESGTFVFWSNPELPDPKCKNGNAVVKLQNGFWKILNCPVQVTITR